MIPDRVRGSSWRQVREAVFGPPPNGQYPEFKTYPDVLVKQVSEFSMKTLSHVSTLSDEFCYAYKSKHMSGQVIVIGEETDTVHRVAFMTAEQLNMPLSTPAFGAAMHNACLPTMIPQPDVFSALKRLLLHIIELQRACLPIGARVVSLSTLQEAMPEHFAAMMLVIEASPESTPLQVYGCDEDNIDLFDANIERPYIYLPTSLVPKRARLIHEINKP